MYLNCCVNYGNRYLVGWNVYVISNLGLLPFLIFFIFVANSLLMKKITLVDDNRDNLEVLSILLEEEGFAVRKAVSAAELFSLLDDFFPDLIFLDVMLGADSGLEVCKKLKGDVATAGIKVVLMTASNAFASLNEGKVGADHYLSKPFDIDEVAELARRLTS